MAAIPIDYAERAVGRPKEFDDRVMKLYPRLRYFAASMGVSDDDEIDDLVQETVMKALASWHLYKEIKGSSFNSWMFVGMRQCLFSAKRKRKPDEDPDDLMAKLLATPANQEDAIILKQTLQQMFSIKGGEEVFLYAQGHSFEEIRTIMGVPSIGTVKSRTSRARERLELV